MCEKMYCNCFLPKKNKEVFVLNIVLFVFHFFMSLLGLGRPKNFSTCRTREERSRGNFMSLSDMS